MLPPPLRLCIVMGSIDDKEQAGVALLQPEYVRLLQERDGSFTVTAMVSQQSEEDRESHTIHRDSSNNQLPAKGSPDPKGV